MTGALGRCMNPPCTSMSGLPASCKSAPGPPVSSQDAVGADRHRLPATDDRGQGDNRNEQLTNVTRALKLLARELDVPVVCPVAAFPGRSRTAATSVRCLGPSGFGRHRAGRGRGDPDVPGGLLPKDGPAGVAEAIVAKQRMGKPNGTKVGGSGCSRSATGPEDWGAINQGEAAQSAEAGIPWRQVFVPCLAESGGDCAGALGWQCLALVR